MGKADQIPVAVVRGVDQKWLRTGSIASEVIRPPAEDLFR
jgi:F420-0:gamma-glutamyl ligase